MVRLAETVKRVVNIVPLNRTSAGAVKGSGVARGDFNRVCAYCPVGVLGSGAKADFKLQESDTDVDGNYADISGAAAVQVAEATPNVCPDIDVRLFKKYVRAVHTVTATTGVNAGVVLLFYDGGDQPVVNTPASVIV